MIRYVLSRRWLLWHVLWAAVVVVCLRLAIWQWDVASQPHPPGAPVQVWRNYAYAINWVIFAVVGVWFWWRFMRDELAAERAAQESADSHPAEGGQAESATGMQGRAVEGVADTATAATTQPVSVRDPVTGGRVRFDPFAGPAEPPEGGRGAPAADG